MAWRTKLFMASVVPAEQEWLNADGAAIWWTVQVAQRWSSTSLEAHYSVYESKVL